jgi:hypothetical protein
VKTIPFSGMTDGFDELPSSRRSFKNASSSCTSKAKEPVISSLNVASPGGLRRGGAFEPVGILAAATLGDAEKKNATRTRASTRQQSVIPKLTARWNRISVAGSGVLFGDVIIETYFKPTKPLISLVLGEVVAEGGIGPRIPRIRCFLSNVVELSNQKFQTSTLVLQ